MYKIFFFISAILMSAKAYCQETNLSEMRTASAINQTDSVEEPADKVFTTVTKEAEFPGGIRGWQMNLMETLDPNLPLRKGAPGGTYRVMVKFIVFKNGKTGNFEAVTNLGYGMEKEVISMIKHGPKWIPAEQNGHPVNAYRYQTVTFVVEQR